MSKQFILIQQFINDVDGSHDQDRPQILETYPTHAAANSAMQKVFDEHIESIECVDKDDTDASHFYASGDDGTQHWWIIEK